MPSWTLPLLPLLIAITAFLGLEVVDRGSEWFWIWNGISLLLLLVQAADGCFSRRRAKDALDREAELIQEYKVAVSDSLSPLARSLALLADLPSAAQRAKDIGQFQTVVIQCAVGLSPARSRATIFGMRETGGVRELYPAPGLTTGRGDLPKTVFREDTVEGKAVWQAAMENKARFCRDMDAEPPAGLDGSIPRAYKTFITTPIYVRENLVGLLTVNSVTAGDLTEEDVETMQIIANILAAGMAMSGVETVVRG